MKLQDVSSSIPFSPPHSKSPLCSQLKGPDCQACGRDPLRRQFSSTPSEHETAGTRGGGVSRGLGESEAEVSKKKEAEEGGEGFSPWRNRQGENRWN